MRHKIIDLFTVFREERKFYASRASNVKLVLKFVALDDAKKELLQNTRLAHVAGAKELR